MKKESIEIKFRKANKDDLQNVFHIIQLAIQDMNNKDIYQWDEIYPDKRTLLQDINKNELYIGFVDDKLVCAFVMNEECNKDYNNGKWEGKDLTFKIIHRLCVNPEFQNKGIGTATVNYIEEQVKSKNGKSIRLDVFSKNPQAIHLYEKSGYKKVGETDWRKGRFYLMEKIL